MKYFLSILISKFKLGKADARKCTVRIDLFMRRMDKRKCTVRIDLFLRRMDKRKCTACTQVYCVSISVSVNCIDLFEKAIRGISIEFCVKQTLMMTARNCV